MNNKDEMKTLLEAMNPISGSLAQLMRQAKYPRKIPGHYPNSDKGEDKVHEFENLIADQYKRHKDPSRSEYQYYYNVDGTKVVFNYRFGVGRSAWWLAGNI